MFKASFLCRTREKHVWRDGPLCPIYLAVFLFVPQTYFFDGWVFHPVKIENIEPFQKRLCIMDGTFRPKKEHFLSLQAMNAKNIDRSWIIDDHNKRTVNMALARVTRKLCTLDGAYGEHKVLEKLVVPHSLSVWTLHS